MALPVLDATFASSADLPRRQMLAKWLVNESGSGSIADYWLLPERYLWAKIAVAVGAPRSEADYISLPTRYVWSDIYNAVAGDSGSHIDWSEKQALGRIAAAYRGDTANPEALATYIDWPWRYQVASIIDAVSAQAGSTFPSDGLLAFWKLDDLTDSSGNANTLTNNNGVTFVSGKIGNAAECGSSGYLNVLGLSWSMSADWSISAWFKHGTVTTFLPTLFDATNGAGYPSIDLTENNEVRINDGGAVFLTAAFTIDAWNHVVLTQQAGTLELWMDGVSQGTASWENSGTASSVYLGTAQSEPRYFEDFIDAVGIWTRALTGEEIAKLYNNGVGLEP